MIAATNPDHHLTVLGGSICIFHSLLDGVFFVLCLKKNLTMYLAYPGAWTWVALRQPPVKNWDCTWLRCFIYTLIFTKSHLRWCLRFLCCRWIIVHQYHDEGYSQWATELFISCSGRGFCVLLFLAWLLWTPASLLHVSWYLWVCDLMLVCVFSSQGIIS